MLSERTSININTVKLVDSKQPIYGLIYSRDLVTLEILKTYIETNLANGFL